MRRKFLPKRESGFFKKLLFWFFTIILSFGLIGILAVAAIFIYFSIGLPNINDLDKLKAPESTQIYDRDGNLLYTIHGEENREEVSIDQISPYLLEATVALEDADFWTHKGFDIWALGKVFLHETFKIGRARGGSTITQQYIKNALLSTEQTYTRKIKELILARRLEKNYSKEKILELYLNRIPYGNNAYGIEKASEIYFDKSAKDLKLEESVILASLPQAPSKYNPFGDRRYSHLLKDLSLEELALRNIKDQDDLLDDEWTFGLIGTDVELADGTTIYLNGRTDIALNQMEDTGAITSNEKETAKENLQTIEFNSYSETIKHPHFVLYIKQELENKYGKDAVEQGGLKVYTTLDPDIQNKAEEVAEEYGAINETNYDADNLAALTINAKTGEILAMIGSRDYWNEEIDGNVNVVFRPRQPGSSFKPFVYAQAFYNGYAPGSVVHDIPTRIGTDRPSNYDGSFSGQMTLRTGLGLSKNIPAIKAYYLAGEQDAIIDLVEKMGINTLNKEHPYGYPLSLGAGEVPLNEMVKAYAVFANNGKLPELTGIIRIENSNGDIIEERTQTEFPEVLDPQIAYLINDILSDKDNSVGPRLFISGKVNAAKTGTSTKANKSESGTSVRPADTWTIGYTPTIVTGVWAGNSDGRGLGYSANGYDTAAPIFNAIMTEALKDEQAEPFPEPEGIKHVEISKASGKLPGENTPESFITTEIFPNFAVPTEKEDNFFKVKIDKISGLRATEFTPEEAIEEVTYQNYTAIADMLNWEEEVKTYYSNKIGEENGVKIGLPPTEYDNIHTSETMDSKPKVSFVYPSSNSRLAHGNFRAEIDIEAANQVERVEYYINNKLEYFTSIAPYTGYLNISRFIENGSKQLIVVKVIDKLGYSSQSAIEIKVDDSSNDNNENEETDDTEDTDNTEENENNEEPNTNNEETI